MVCGAVNEDRVTPVSNFCAAIFCSHSLGLKSQAGLLIKIKGKLILNDHVSCFMFPSFACIGESYFFFCQSDLNNRGTIHSKTFRLCGVKVSQNQNLSPTAGSILKKRLLTLWNLTSVCIFSILFSIPPTLLTWRICLTIKKLLQLVIISFVLLTLMLKSRVIL